MLEAIPRLVAEGVLVDACVTDPPYHLTSVARGQTPGSVAASKDVFLRVKSGGFMGQGWDGGDIALRPETWAAVATIMRPGAFLVAFGGTRTHHRVWCAIEDAGFVIQDTIMWMFGTGFPKRHDMLKPAYEPICLAYKPGGKRTMQINECRVELNGDYKSKANGRPSQTGLGDFYDPAVANQPDTLGRWPANVCHDGSDEVLAAFPDSAGQQGDVTGLGPSSKTNNVYGQFSGRPATKARREGEASADRRYTEEGASDFAMLPGIRRNDGASAARFFWSSKANAQDRWGSRHPTVKPVDLIAWLVALVTPPGGTFLDCFAGSGTAGMAALKTGRNAILIERDDAYAADIRERMAHYAGDGRHSLASKGRNAREQVGSLL